MPWDFPNGMERGRSHGEASVPRDTLRYLDVIVSYPDFQTSVVPSLTPSQVGAGPTLVVLPVAHIGPKFCIAPVQDLPRSCAIPVQSLKCGTTTRSGGVFCVPRMGLIWKCDERVAACVPD